MRKIQLLDCTLRDGAYIVNAEFGTPAIKGIIKRLQEANVDIIECGWLKNTPHKEGTSFYHVPSDLDAYLINKKHTATRVVMIDWDRYDLDNLPQNDGRYIDAIRIVFPKDKFREGVALADKVRQKGYEVYFQAANTYGYSDEDLKELAKVVNQAKPVSLSVVDTFGAMYEQDLAHIVGILDSLLDKDIKLGLHTHNNQQLSFALSISFLQQLAGGERDLIVDASLCGMGRGAGNATTELIANYLNRKYFGNYDMNVIMDTIDTYMTGFIKNYTWGYSTPYFISGIYCAHVNNIAYLLKEHKTKFKDMRSIIESLSVEDRRKYDYDLLEKKYIDYESKVVDDEEVVKELSEKLADKSIVLVMPGKSAVESKAQIDEYIKNNNSVVIGVNAVQRGYKYDYLFFSNNVRYDYAKDVYHEVLANTPKIVTSNIKTEGESDEAVVNFNLLIKRGWEHFDNAGMMCLRLLNRLNVSDVALAGFDGFSGDYSESYSDKYLPHINPGKKWNELNEEIKDMFTDFKNSASDTMDIKFLTKSKYDE